MTHCGDESPRLCLGVVSPECDAATAEVERRARDRRGVNDFIAEGQGRKQLVDSSVMRRVCLWDRFKRPIRQIVW